MAAVDSRDLRENTVGAKSWEVAPPRDAARADLEIRGRIEQILEMQTYIYHLYLLAHLFVSWNILNTHTNFRHLDNCLSFMKFPNFLSPPKFCLVS